jgi:hypothetical protein
MHLGDLIFPKSPDLRRVACNDLASVAWPRLVHKARLVCLFSGMSYSAPFYSCHNAFMVFTISKPFRSELR